MFPAAHHHSLQLAWRQRTGLTLSTEDNNFANKAPSLGSRKSRLWLSPRFVSTRRSPAPSTKKYHYYSTIWESFIKKDIGLIKPEDWISLPLHSSRCTLGLGLEMGVGAPRWWWGGWGQGFNITSMCLVHRTYMLGQKKRKKRKENPFIPNLHMMYDNKDLQRGMRPQCCSLHISFMAVYSPGWKAL